MDPVQLYTLLGVLAVLLGVIAYNNVVAALASRRARVGAAAPAGWVGRHVQFEGDVVGEVIAQADDLLILRKGPSTLAVPRSQVRPQGLDLGLKSFDSAAALAAGLDWQARTGAA